MSQDDTVKKVVMDLTILKDLQACGDYPMPRHSLLQTVQLQTSPKPLESEVEERIRSLDSRGLINAVKGAIGYKYTISDAGRLFLKEHG